MSMDTNNNARIRTFATPPPLPHIYATELEHVNAMFETTRSFIASAVMYLARWGRSDGIIFPTPPGTPHSSDSEDPAETKEGETVFTAKVKSETVDVSLHQEEGATGSSKGKQRKAGKQSAQESEDVLEFIQDVISHLPLHSGEIMHSRQQILRNLLRRAVTNPIHPKEHIPQGTREVPAPAPQPCQLINPDGTSKVVTQVNTRARRATRKSRSQAQKPFTLKVHPPSVVDDEPQNPLPIRPFSVKFVPDAASTSGRIVRVDATGKITMSKVPRVPPAATLPPATVPAPAPQNEAVVTVEMPASTPPTTALPPPIPHSSILLLEGGAETKVGQASGVPRHYPTPLEVPLPPTAVFGPGPDRDGANHFPPSFHTPMSRPIPSSSAPLSRDGPTLHRTYTFYDQSHPEIFWNRAAWGVSPCPPPDASSAVSPTPAPRPRGPMGPPTLPPTSASTVSPPRGTKRSRDEDTVESVDTRPTQRVRRQSARLAGFSAGLKGVARSVRDALRR